MRAPRRQMAPLVVAFVGLAACSGGSGRGTSSSGITDETSTSRIGTTTPGPASTPTTGTSADPLEALLLVSVPAGYLQQPDTVGDTGPSDLAKAVRDDGSPDAQAVLTQDGFVHGYQRLWQTADQRQIVIFIYQFRTAAGASAYQQRTVTKARSDPQNPASPFAVSGIPGEAGLSATSGGTSTAVALFTKGAYLVQLVVNGAAQPGNQDLVQQLALTEYGHL